LVTKYDVKWAAIVGSLSYFIGASFFQVSATAELLGCVSQSCSPFLTVWPTRLGGALFVLGGVCEVLVNRTWASKPRTLVSWVVLCNCVGDVLFFWSTLPGLTEYASQMCVFAGVVAFLIGSVVSLAMWKVGQFGYALLSQLNTVARESGVSIIRLSDNAIIVPDSGRHSWAPGGMSVGGIIFILICTCCGTWSLIDLSIVDKHPPTQIRDVTLSVCFMLNVVFTHMVLILCSTMHKTPEVQPYRCLVIVLRYVMVVMLLNGVYTLSIFLSDEA